jgi:hypothetical protein
MVTKVYRFLMVLLLLTLIAGCGEQKQPSSLIPEISQENAPLIDGTLSPGEWDAARQESFTDGSQLFLLVSGGYLYLGIHVKSPDMITGNVYINHGDEISILHTSAALGTAVYQKSADGWALNRDFTWQCRDLSDSQAAQAERRAFLQQEGWVGSIVYRGNPEELEYQTQLTGDSMRLVVAILKESDPGVRIAWPTNVKDDTLQIFPGDLPANLSFAPDTWAEISITGDGELEVKVANP